MLVKYIYRAHRFALKISQFSLNRYCFNKFKMANEMSQIERILNSHQEELVISKLPLIVIIGATGCGKTKLSIELAKKYNGEVINADAMQTYKGLYIATNKATVEERDNIKHHLIDFVDPFKQFTVVDFQKSALKTIESIVKRGKLPIVVGGTNYYIESILWDTLVQTTNQVDDIDIESEEISNDLIETIEDLFKHPITYKNLKSVPDEKLHKFLSEIDPKSSKILAVSNRRKVIRSLQIYQQTGVKSSELLEEQRSHGSRHGGPLRFQKAIIFWLDCDKNVLDDRLDRRVDEMLNNGLIDELLQFHQDYNNKRINENKKVKYTEGIFQAIGLKEFHHFLIRNEEDQKSYEGQLKLGHGIILLKQRTKSYVTKQLKWIKRRFLISENIRQVPNVYRLDTSVPEMWPNVVLKPAIQIVDHCIEEILSDDPMLCTQIRDKLNKMKAEVKMITDDNDLFISGQYFCEICQVSISGGHSYQSHLLSKKHKYQQQQLEMK